ncbi:MAG: GTP cyclohydrolase I FolE2 [Burkholderiaceae bacterium]|nr:GTP cyclohydrolase I FolE2 [Burkholderiaceae bacterium]
MNAPEIKSLSGHAAMPDIQGSHDHRDMPIEQVGVRGVRYPVLIAREDGSSQPSVGEFSLSVGLPAHQKGTHMSRFIELLESLNQRGISLSAASMRAALSDMLKRLAAESGIIEVSLPFFMMKAAPISGVQSMMDYRCRWSAEQIAFSAGETPALRLSCEVKVPVKSLCPCSKEISEYGAHNQRSEVTVSVTLRDDADFSVESLVRTIESQASCELWGLLKRPDEKYVTERAYDNPKFVEDLVRDVATAVRSVGGVAGYVVEAENFESIHNHSAWARIVG